MLVSTFILKPYLLVGAMSGYCEISRTPVDSSSADHAPAMRGKCSGEGKWEIFLSDFLWFSGPRFPYLTRASASNLPRSSRQVSFAATVEKKDKFTFQRLVSIVTGSMIGLADFICLSLMFGCGWLSRDFAVIMIMNKAQKSDIYCLKHSITITASVESFEF